MTYIVTAKQMADAEKSACGTGASFTELMERAGTACAEIIYEDYCKNNSCNVLILCGKGKNGGDGFVAARILSEKGVNVCAALLCGTPAEGDQKKNYELLKKCKADIKDVTDSSEKFIKLAAKYDIFVDAVFGTGFRGVLSDFLSSAAKWVKESGKPLISIDVPSGINCDNCESSGVVFQPDTTIAISAFKPIHITKPYSDKCGKTIIADIGITDDDFISSGADRCFTYDENDIKILLPKRYSDSNKSTYGKALCVCGSYKMPGAAYMSTSGALRTGAGLVTCCFPKSAYPALSAKLTEAVLLPVSETHDGTFSYSALSEIRPAVKKSSAVLAGCGIRLNKDTTAVVSDIIGNSEVPLVLDADALNAVSGYPDMLLKAKSPVIITPHPGEMSRLCGKSIQDILKNPIKHATDFSKKYNCTIVLKTANTVVTSPDKKNVYINHTGNSGLSKGGSGDLLAGIMVSLLAQGMSPMEAACASVYIHGECADELSKKLSKRGMLVSDLIDYLPVYLKKYE